jgi:hypothetical protein
LFVDPLPHKRRQRMTIEQFNGYLAAGSGKIPGEFPERF